MRWLCIFAQCNWIWHFNVENPQTVGSAGVYQCTRCKTISIGATR